MLISIFFKDRETLVEFFDEFFHQFSDFLNVWIKSDEDVG